MIKVAIIGYGNIGKAVEQAVLAAEDMTLTGIYHHNDLLIKEVLSPGSTSQSSVQQLLDADVCVLCTPTREVPKFAAKLVARGICTVDSFDIHGQILDYRAQLQPLTREQHSVSIIAAGWDPGSDSVVRALLQAMAPQGLTYTNFGPGRSMGHTVAAKSIEGVKNALSMTIPLGTGIHRRMVYVELEDGADFRTVEQNLLRDDYFAHDETHVIAVPSVDALNNVAHGVHLVRNGVSANMHNQNFEFNMSINNPALTGQILVACARAAVRMQQRGQCGCFTMIELAPIDLLSGTTEENIKALV